MRTKILLPSLITLVIAPQLLLGATAIDILKRAQDAEEYVSYRGTKIATVFFGGRFAESFIKVVHLKPDKTRTEYFSPSRLAGIILIQNGPNIWKYYPGETSWEQVRSSALTPPDTYRQGAFDNYNIRLLGKDHVAGRETYVIHAAPRHAGEAAHRLWIDSQYFLIIRNEMESMRGTVLNSSRYTKINLNPKDISPTIFKVTGKVKTQPRTGSLNFRVEKPSYLPKGYRLVGTAMIIINERSCAHLKYSNGVNTFSIFQHRSERKSPPVPIPSKVTHAITWARNGMQFTMIGDLPNSELKKIANSTK